MAKRDDNRWRWLDANWLGDELPDPGVLVLLAYRSPGGSEGIEPAQIGDHAPFNWRWLGGDGDGIDRGYTLVAWRPIPNFPTRKAGKK